MRTEQFRVVKNLNDVDPLTDSQVRELTGADKDDVVDLETAARMLGVCTKSVLELVRQKKLIRMHCSPRKFCFLKRDVRAYRDSTMF